MAKNGWFERERGKRNKGGGIGRSRNCEKADWMSSGRVVHVEILVGVPEQNRRKIIYNSEVEKRGRDLGVEIVARRHKSRSGKSRDVRRRAKRGGSICEAQ